MQYKRMEKSTTSCQRSHNRIYQTLDASVHSIKNNKLKAIALHTKITAMNLCKVANWEKVGRSLLSKPQRFDVEFWR